MAFNRYVQGDHHIYFGDGTTSQIADKKKFQTPKGITRWRFLLWPSRRQKTMYHIEEDDMYDADNDLIRKEYDATDVIVIENNPGRTRVWVVRAFDNGETEMSQRESYLKRTIDYMEKEVKSLSTALASAQQDLHIERTNQMEATRDKVNIILEANKARGRSNMEEEEFPDDSMASGGG